MVDETPAGEPVVEVRGARLVLRDHATFFNRLVPCSNCGRETAGSAVRTPADLDLPPVPATCRDCRRAAASVAPASDAPAPVPVEDTSGPRLDALEARIDELQAALERPAPEPGPAEDEGEDRLAAVEERLAQAMAEAAAVEKRLTQRLDKLDAKGRSAAADTPRMEALERRVEQLAALMAERESRLEEQLDAVRASATGSMADVQARVDAVDARFDQSAAEMNELADLHAALDVGLGKLRTELGAVRDRQREMSVLQDEFDRRLETVAAIQRAVTAEEGKGGRRGGKRSNEFTTQVAAAQAATDELAKEQKTLRAQLSVIELATDRAAETAGKAWSQLSAVGPLLMQVDALEERLDIQNEALAALTETVQSLLRTGPGRPPPAKKAAPAAKKAAPAAKTAARATKKAVPRKAPPPGK